MQNLESGLLLRLHWRLLQIRAQYRDHWINRDRGKDQERWNTDHDLAVRHNTTDFHTYNGTDVAQTATMHQLSDADFFGLEPPNLDQMMDGLMTQEEKDTVLILTGQLTPTDSDGTETTKNVAGKRSRTRGSDNAGNRQPKKSLTDKGDRDQ